jgi:hypothetical protein
MLNNERKSMPTRSEDQSNQENPFWIRILVLATLALGVGGMLSIGTPLAQNIPHLLR